MKISDYVEQLFATAVALSQDSGLRNTIYAVNKEIFILNYDHTLLIRFRLRETEPPFSSPVSFNANDYDSEYFEEKDGKIVFTTSRGEYTRKKTCGVPGLSAEDVKRLFKRYLHVEGSRVELHKQVLELLDRDLSHVEFSGKAGGALSIVQRNIYDGTIIEVSQRMDGFTSSTLDCDFGPIAVKTGDFVALFSFQESLRFTFPSVENDSFILIDSLDRNRRDMKAIVSCAIYDEIVAIRESREEK